MVISHKELHLLRVCIHSNQAQNSDGRVHFNSIVRISENFLETVKVRSALKILETLGEIVHVGHSWFSLQPPVQVFWNNSSISIGLVQTAKISKTFPATYSTKSSMAEKNPLTEWLGPPFNSNKTPDFFFREPEEPVVVDDLRGYEFFCVQKGRLWKECWTEFSRVNFDRRQKPLVGRSRERFENQFVQYLPSKGIFIRLNSSQAYELASLNWISSGSPILFKLEDKLGRHHATPLMVQPQSIRQLMIICSDAIEIQSGKWTYMLSPTGLTTATSLTGEFLRFKHKEK